MLHGVPFSYAVFETRAYPSPVATYRLHTTGIDMPLEMGVLICSLLACFSKQVDHLSRKELRFPNLITYNLCGREHVLGG